MNKIALLLSLGLVATLPVAAIDIFYEISHKNFKAINSWLKPKPDTSICNEQGQSILHTAVLTGNNKIVKAILKTSIDVNMLDKFGKTALDYAVEYGNINIILNLVTHKAKVTSLQESKYVAQLVQQERKKFWMILAFKVGILVPLVLLVGTLLGGYIVETIFGLAMNMTAATTLSYIIVGTTIAICECFLIPWYLALPLGFIWANVMLETSGMIVIILPVAALIGVVAVGIVGALHYTYHTIRPEEDLYLLTA